MIWGKPLHTHKGRLAVAFLISIFVKDLKSLIPPWFHAMCPPNTAHGNRIFVKYKLTVLFTVKLLLVSYLKAL